MLIFLIMNTNVSECHFSQTQYKRKSTMHKSMASMMEKFCGVSNAASMRTGFGATSFHQMHRASKIWQSKQTHNEFLSHAQSARLLETYKKDISLICIYVQQSALTMTD